MTERRLNTVQAVRYSLEIVLSPGGSGAAAGAAAGGPGPRQILITQNKSTTQVLMERLWTEEKSDANPDHQSSDVTDI